jgi:Reverse transcriptase (RNA-dependent DNA polymerase)/GAG-pre-integrase domain
MSDHDFGPFIELTETVLELDTIFRPTAQNQANRPPRVSAAPISSAPLLPPTSSTLPEPSSRIPKKDQTCNNCKSRGLRAVGHTDGTCFQPGGGMEGRREEYLNNRGRIHAMLAECLENALASPEPLLPPDPSSPSNSPIISPTLDNEILLPHIANLSVASYMPNSDFHEDAYNRCDLKMLPHLAFATVDFNSTALVSLVALYNSLLDSGCTHHIVRDRALFRNYTARTISVGTANCGSLEALGTGDVEFRYVLGDQRVIFTLRGCLYAPSAPINLLSVGALAERGLTCLFSPGGITKIFYPEDHPRLPGFFISATVVNRLSFLNLTFLPPSDSSLAPTALPAMVILSSPLPIYSFPRVKQDSILWHCRFGHIGMDATKATLTKNYVKGINFEGSFVYDHCIPCIVGKSPQRSYTYHGNCATKIGELLHMDLCGPFPTQAPHGEKYFFNILDDKSNWGFTYGLRLKSDAFSCHMKTEAFLKRSNSAIVLSVRCGGELEFTAGKMGAHFATKGIALQQTVAYAHQQNGKSKHYIRTIEEGGQALLADSGLPMSFWLDAVLTRQYLVNRLPTSTLPSNTTPFESLTGGRKPDLSHLRVWGCDCYVAVPAEIRGKAGPKRFRAIFVGYEEHRIGWRVRDLAGKYSFSNDVIFNENLPARLGVPRSLPPLVPDAVVSPLRPLCERSRVRTTAGQAYDDVMELKRFRNVERERRLLLKRNVAVDGGATVNGDAVDGGVATVGVVDDFDGGVDVVHLRNISRNSGFAGGASDLSPSLDAIESFLSFLDSSSFPDPIDTVSLIDTEPVLIQTLFSISDPFVFKAFSPPFSRPFDLSKPPSSYTVAIARSDAHIWHSAMDREKKSLTDMGAFEEVELPKGERAIGLKWVYDIKTDATGARIHGKEKARLVAQGFNQRPGQYDETYAPVAKMASVRILLAWAAVNDLEIFQFDCKTAFLHAKVRHPLYARPFPGYPTSTPGKYLRILVALYGLRQSAYEFYILILSLLLELGMVRCEVDHGIFFGIWTSSPDPSVPMPLADGPLVLYVPLHVDDGLAITNSIPLYTWFLSVIAKRLHIVDMGPRSKFLNILIIRDRAGKRLWLSPRLYISELLEEWNLASCRSVVTPFPSKLPDSISAPPNSSPAISDADLLPRYQRLVGCLLYLAISTQPDIAYYAMWLGQFNASPTRAHFLIAKHVLRYLAGTRTLALCLGVSSPRVPPSLSGYMQNVGCSDADWASNTVDRRSISGYSFYFQGSLISWSAVKQKAIALSSTEAEYYAMTHAFKEASWLRTFLGLLQLPVPRPFPILSDNQAACSISNSSAISARSKHIDNRHHFIRDHVQAGSFTTTWIPTEDMPADIFTKSLPSATFSRHRDILGLSVPLL